MKIQRIRDPIHDLITFDLDADRDGLAWKLINSREFQRLRRIRQLGFSEFVFPGATHTRFSHCLGAFFIARKLLEIIQKKVSNPDPRRVFVSSIAALLHDLGHGPFSHAFEEVQKSLGRAQKHEKWTSDFIRGDSEVRRVLNEYDESLAEEVAQLLARKDPADIYDAIVSSQFDADRLDYLQRDRYMTGTQTGGFDQAWLLDCLETGKISVGREGEDEVQVDGLYLNHKGLAAAEGYLLARYHIYSQVYLHKTTRSAERMLVALLTRLAALIRDDNLDASGLRTDHTLVRFLKSETVELESYIDLDDFTIWSALSDMTHATDDLLQELARRIRTRRLYKCIDVGARAQAIRGDSLTDFKRRLRGLRERLGTSVLTDDVTLTAYGVHDYEDREALEKVLIGGPNDGTRIDDICERSQIVKSLERQKIFRVYYRDASDRDAIEQLWREVIQ